MSDPIESHVLQDGDTRITVLSVGCVVQDWQVAGRRVVLGYSDPEEYRENPASMGMVVGRVANRISGGRFTLHGTEWALPTNEKGVTLHGGPGGLGRRHWRIEPEGPRAVTFRFHSPHLDQGFPGAVDFRVRMSLEGAALTWEMSAIPDRETPVNMAQHVYFNLAGQGTIRDHRFRLDASRYTPNGPDLIPTGEILPVEGTRYDFRAPRTLAEADPEKRGYDLNFALDPGDGPQFEAVSPDGMRLRLTTDKPGLQFYTCAMLRPFGTPWPGVAHGPFGGFCIEAQDFPNAINTPGFGSILCSPEAPYRQTTRIEIAPD